MCSIAPRFIIDVAFCGFKENNRDTKGYVRFEKCISFARLVPQILAYKEAMIN